MDLQKGLWTYQNINFVSDRTYFYLILVQRILHQNGEWKHYITVLDQETKEPSSNLKWVAKKECAIMFDQPSSTWELLLILFLFKVLQFLMY